MAAKKEDIKIKEHHWKNKNGNFGGSIYGLGFVGAAIYYLQHSHTFWMGVLGLLKTIVWPALLIYRLLDLLKI